MKLLLFDFGGVIAPEGFQLGVLKLAFKYGRNFKEMYELAGYQAGLLFGYTTGKRTENEYWEELARLLGRSGEDISEDRWLILDNFQPRKRMLELIRQLHTDGIEMGIFSDQTNWIYEVDKEIPFLYNFKYTFISCDLGFSKHDEQFYGIPSEKTGIKPGDITVIDDKERVVTNCRKAGMKAFLFTTVPEFEKALPEIIRG